MACSDRHASAIWTSETHPRRLDDPFFPFFGQMCRGRSSSSSPPRTMASSSAASRITTLFRRIAGQLLTSGLGPLMLTFMMLGAVHAALSSGSGSSRSSFRARVTFLRYAVAQWTVGWTISSGPETRHAHPLIWDSDRVFL